MLEAWKKVPEIGVEHSFKKCTEDDRIEYDRHCGENF